MFVIVHLIFLFQCRSITSLNQNLSFKAISADNQIIGVVLCREILRDVNGFPTYNNIRLKHIAGLLEEAGHKYGTIWDHVPPEVDRVGLICIVSVAKECQGLGIASQLLQAAKNKLRLHFRAALIECSNPNMARSSQKTMVHMATVPFNEYKDSDEGVVFDADSPENSLNLYYEIF